jgi:uncharacterized protein (DUF697 family)
MNPEVRRLTTRYSALTAVVSFLTQPIPAADEIIVIPIHYWFAVLLIRKRGRGVLEAPWWQVSKIIWGGASARCVAGFTVGLIPLAGGLSNAVTAVAVTEMLASYLDQALSNPDRPPPEISMRSVRDSLVRRRGSAERRARKGQRG